MQENQVWRLYEASFQEENGDMKNSVHKQNNKGKEIEGKKVEREEALICVLLVECPVKIKNVNKSTMPMPHPCSYSKYIEGKKVSNA